MLTSILPVVGVLVGASLQYFFTRYLEAQRYQRDLRTGAYIDYVKAVSGLATLTIRRDRKSVICWRLQLTPKPASAFMVPGRLWGRLLHLRSSVQL
jgi:hypothetical protein